MENKDINSLLQGYDSYVSGESEIKIQEENKNDEEMQTSKEEKSTFDSFDSLIDEMMGKTEEVHDNSSNEEETKEDEITEEDQEKKELVTERESVSVIENKEEKTDIKEDKQETVKAEKGKKVKTKKRQLSAEELKRKAEIRESYLKDHKKFYIGVGALVLTLWIATGALGYTSAMLVDEFQDNSLQNKLVEAQKEKIVLESDLYYTECERDQALSDLEKLKSKEEEYKTAIQENKDYEILIDYYESRLKYLDEQIIILTREKNALLYDNEEYKITIETYKIIKAEIEEELKALKIEFEEYKANNPPQPSETTENVDEMGN